MYVIYGISILIPVSLQIYYDIYPMYLSFSGVFLMGIFYHNHLLKTNNNPYKIFVIIDITLVLISSFLVLMNEKNKIKILFLCICCPILYSIGKIKNDCYIHSFLHMIAILSSSLIVFDLKNKNFEVIDAIIVTTSSYIGFLSYKRSLEFFENNNSLQDKK